QQVGGHWEIWDVWQRVQCGEILVLRGENSDLLTQDILQRMLQSRQHITCIEYPGIGHAPTLMAESRIKAVEHFVRAN
ncbi:alpha/beta hydrolase, partial [Anaplasma capra]|nr:alpha/beta hydrolase [Anaplasma capra]